MSQSRLEQMAREREEDRKTGRPERGLFTGRGPKKSNARHDRDTEPPSHRRDPSDDDYDSDDDRFEREVDDEPRGSRRVAKHTILQAIRQLPAYVRLLIGLFGDSRVSRVDRFMVLATVAYIVSPIDLVPDFIPFFGQIDDMFLLILSLQRLVRNTSVRVLRVHWKGNPRDLSELNLASLLSAAGFFLPSQLRLQLKRMASRGDRHR